MRVRGRVPPGADRARRRFLAGLAAALATLALSRLARRPPASETATRGADGDEAPLREARHWRRA